MNSETKPTVAIVIPCRNEEKYIEQCVSSILSNTYPKELTSIYVCDGLSTDNTRDIVSKISSEHSNVHLIDNDKQTTPFALNLGLKASNADIKVILGAHSEVNSEFIVENVKAFEVDERIGCTGGLLENIYENNTAEVIGLAMSSSFGVGNAHFRTGAKNGFVDTVAFGAYKKEVFEKAGYFDESLTRNQDDEFNYRVLKKGFKIYLSNKIKCKYYVRGSFKKLFRQYYQYGYWKVFVNKKHKTVTTLRQIVPLVFVLYLLFGLGTLFIHIWLFYAYLAGIGVYLIGAIISALKVGKAHLLFKLICTYFILHLSYGWGYLLGIIDFFVFNKQPGSSSEKLSR